MDMADKAHRLTGGKLEEMEKEFLKKEVSRFQNEPTEGDE